MKWLASWAAAVAISLLRWTCRIRVHDDPRDELRAAGRPYIYSILHAHQVAITIGAEPGTGAMVSRSADGQIIVPALKIRGCVPVRGSGRGSGADKGGRAALAALIEHVRTGRPAVLAVDGPRGPRNHVHKGIATLSQETGAVVLNVVTVPTRRWILSHSWDRLQIPMPLCTIHAYFAPPIEPLPEEGIEAYRKRIELSLNTLERKHDAAEAARSLG
ncbi:lysophospholipid acyltransferase family protein [Candidatus Laterigemmans baculatus]|uniref:lysophospholipid acyltransferase family protein n=1 Tax=Candidatus Laterigemmans baculatus TaxID=2770505 RepID=UPI0013DBC44D|nr:lysophospholipid acyltransferase family protein [Candidatus Laterigemmans baculatus]